MRNAIRYASPIAPRWICAILLASTLALPAEAQTLPPELITAREKWEEYFHKATAIEGTVRAEFTFNGTVQKNDNVISFGVEGNSGFFHTQNTSP